MDDKTTLPQRLRDGPSESDILGAADMLEQQAAEIAALREWHQAGEAIITGHSGWSVPFRIGAWWADRPWRRTTR